MAEEDAKQVACSLATEAGWVDDCRLEITVREGQRILVLRHPDGGFRRLMERGEGFVTLDGMHDVALETNASQRVVTIDGDSYAFSLGDFVND